MVTTIQINESTKHELEAMKQQSSQTYQEVIEKLIELAKEENAELTESTKKAIKRARQDVKYGRIYTTDQLIRELGI